MRIYPIAFVALVVLAGCKKQDAAPSTVYQAVPVDRRDIVVSVQAAGAIQPDTTVEVKSKASGEILQIMVETGQLVHRGELMVSIDPRTARNTMAQTQAQFDVARATLANARSQKRRSDELYRSQSITETENETAQLAYANAIADSVSGHVALENARIRLEDTDVRSPITGVVIEKDVERGQVISSPTSDVGGGTVLLKMADLSLVQVNTLVDETDIGKIQPGLTATITVDAYPNRPFDGTVLKIEPQAVTQQNVTMFPVRVRIQNKDGLLRPGMNAEVEIHVGRRDRVLSVPNAALRTTQDVASAAGVLGIDPKDVDAQLAAAQPATRQDSMGARTTGTTPPAGTSGDSAQKPAGNTLTLPDGRSIPLPEGVTAAQVQVIMRKRMSGGQVTPEETAVLRKVFAGMGGGRNGGRSRAQSNDYQFGGRYIVFVLRNKKPTPVNVRTGLTDMDYSEVVEGLTEKDSVLILPSASLVQSQQDFKDRMGRITGSGSMGGLRQATPAGGTSGATRP